MTLTILEETSQSSHVPSYEEGAKESGNVNRHNQQTTNLWWASIVGRLSRGGILCDIASSSAALLPLPSRSFIYHPEGRESITELVKLALSYQSILRASLRLLQNASALLCGRGISVPMAPLNTLLLQNPELEEKLNRSCPVLPILREAAAKSIARIASAIEAFHTSLCSVRSASCSSSPSMTADDYCSCCATCAMLQATSECIQKISRLQGNIGLLQLQYASKAWSYLMGLLITWLATTTITPTTSTSTSASASTECTSSTSSSLAAEAAGFNNTASYTAVLDLIKHESVLMRETFAFKATTSAWPPSAAGLGSEEEDDHADDEIHDHAHRQQQQRQQPQQHQQRNRQQTTPALGGRVKQEERWRGIRGRQKVVIRQGLQSLGHRLALGRAKIESLLARVFLLQCTVTEAIARQNEEEGPVWEKKKEELIEQLEILYQQQQSLLTTDEGGSGEGSKILGSFGIDMKEEGRKLMEMIELLKAPEDYEDGSGLLPQATLATEADEQLSAGGEGGLGVVEGDNTKAAALLHIKDEQLMGLAGEWASHPLVDGAEETEKEFRSKAEDDLSSNVLEIYEGASAPHLRNDDGNGSRGGEGDDTDLLISRCNHEELMGELGRVLDHRASSSSSSAAAAAAAAATGGGRRELITKQMEKMQPKVLLGSNEECSEATSPSLLLDGAKRAKEEDHSASAPATTNDRLFAEDSSQQAFLPQQASSFHLSAAVPSSHGLLAALQKRRLAMDHDDVVLDGVGENDHDAEDGGD